jgi:hypothetical protein
MKLPAALLMIASAAAVAGVAQAKAPPSEDAQFRRWLRSYLLDMPYNEDDPDLKNLVYGYALVDLNGDGRNEAVVWARDANLCGTSGCGLDIFVHGKSGWQYFIDVATTRPPIKILPTRTHGWHDLSSWQYGGGVDHAYEAWWQFNGGNDYGNFRTKWKVPQRIQGRVIIKDATIPLFPNTCHKVEEAPSVFGPIPMRSAKAGSC